MQFFVVLCHIALNDSFAQLRIQQFQCLAALFAYLQLQLLFLDELISSKGIIEFLM